MELSELKSVYEKFEKKYALPSFDKINQNFEIEKIERESDILLRLIRKIMLEKIINSLNFIEMLYNPANAPRVYQPYLRTMNSEDKSLIDKLYSSLSELSIDSLSLEVESSEKKEAEEIIKIFNVWEKSKKDFASMISKIRNPVNNQTKKEKSYFG